MHILKTQLVSMYHQLYFLPPLSCFHAHLLALSHLWDMVVCTELNCPLRNKPDCYTPEFAVVSLLLDCIIHHLSHSSFHSALRLTWFNRFSNCLRNLHSCWSRKCIFFSILLSRGTIWFKWECIFFVARAALLYNYACERHFWVCWKIERN